MFAEVVIMPEGDVFLNIERKLFANRLSAAGKFLPRMIKQSC